MCMHGVRSKCGECQLCVAEGEGGVAGKGRESWKRMELVLLSCRVLRV